LLVAVVAASCSACSLLLATQLSDARPDTSDAASTADAESGMVLPDGANPPAAPAGDAAADVETVAAAGGLIQEDYTDSTECGRWTVHDSITIQPVGDGHAAPGSCSICASSVGGGYVSRVVDIVRLGSYTLNLWAKGTPNTTRQFYPGLRFFAADNSTVLNHTIAPDLSDDWKLAQLSNEATSGAVKLEVSLFLGGVANDCISFDDVTLSGP
jgi:hypothetical protein